MVKAWAPRAFACAAAAGPVCARRSETSWRPNDFWMVSRYGIGLDGTRLKSAPRSAADMPALERKAPAGAPGAAVRCRR
ncbi:MAG TPA: hypothetical protein VJZ76_19430 [Thermoanaerobaculia bacterium]|nr:hypothetical protein [Thermoanaerobaculia bacterium]